MYMQVPIVLVLFSVLSRRVHALYVSDITIMNTGYVETHNDDIISECLQAILGENCSTRQRVVSPRPQFGRNVTHGRKK